MVPPYWLNIADFETFVAHPDNAGRRFELINGEFFEKRVTEIHNACFVRLHNALRDYVQTNQLGQIRFNVRHQVKNDDYNVRIPDLEFQSKWRSPPEKQGDAELHMPDIAIEIKAPHDDVLDLREKALFYLKYGTIIVWLVFPSKQQIEVHTIDSITTLSGDDTLTDVYFWRDFPLLVKDIFTA